MSSSPASFELFIIPIISGIVFAFGVHTTITPWLTSKSKDILRNMGFIALAGTILTQAGMFLCELRLYPYGQASLQLAMTSQKIREILSTWNEGQRAWIGFSFGLDVIYIQCYCTLIAIGALYFSPPASNNVSSYIATAVYVAGLLDVVESFVFMEIVGNPKNFSERLPMLGFSFAMCKFVLLAISIIFVLISRSTNNKNNDGKKKQQKGE
jgi:hypothetical protein